MHGVRVSTLQCSAIYTDLVYASVCLNFSTDALPSGLKVVSLPPSEDQLAFKGPRAKELVGRHILFNWMAVGWCVGTILRSSGDKSKKIQGIVANFLVKYPADETQGLASLYHSNYGDKG